ncbi:hypothetical protein AU512_02830 [Lonsdalea iberica]|uniref:Uncharacterized protein n=1 Tax=Lonsdalea iberica TaxID=1082703 RepID=A0ABX3XII5_9GAMM|nr:hypothetical protein [Lonsdalea iberica]OSN11422.1 hypothetical protein AU512_02830 [Lonsdalea iberica]
MPRFNIFRGSASASTYSAIVENYDTGSKVHDTRSTSQLGLSGYQYKNVVVKSGTLSALADACWANRVVKKMLPHGAGNQRQDVRASSGESWARMHLAYQKYPHGGIENQIKRAQKFQGGNCAVHAAVAVAALKERNVSQPICRVRLQLPENNSHEFVMLGDPRDPTWGERNTVVVDAWPTHPSACTLDQSMLHDMQRDTHAPMTELMATHNHLLWDASDSANRSDIRRLKEVEVLSSEALQQKLAKAGLPSLHSDDLVRHALRDDSFNRFDVRVATDPSTTYSDSAGHRGQSVDYLLSNR